MVFLFASLFVCFIILFFLLCPMWITNETKTIAIVWRHKTPRWQYNMQFSSLESFYHFSSFLIETRVQLETTNDFPLLILPLPLFYSTLYVVSHCVRAVKRSNWRVIFFSFEMKVIPNEREYCGCRWIIIVLTTSKIERHKQNPHFFFVISKVKVSHVLFWTVSVNGFIFFPLWFSFGVVLPASSKFKWFVDFMINYMFFGFCWNCIAIF